jgi:hypothetical protein
MPVDEPFPLESVPSRVRQAILSEFKGRCPSVREVAEIPDAYWLATPAMGRRFLQMIRDITHAPGRQADAPVRPRLTDAELLDRLESLQRELQWLQATLKAKTRRMPRSRDRRPFGERSRPSQDLSLG